jgi:ammonia channel protein AmtB
MGVLASVLGLLAQTPAELREQIEDLQGQVSLNAQVLTEFYFFISLPIMWLIHVGFLLYEGGVARRKNVMSTVFKNFLTIAVVTPVFYYLGWWIYGCFQTGGLSGPTGPENNPALGPDVYGAGNGFCGATYPWSNWSGPVIDDHITAVFLLAFIIFSWVTGSILSGAVIERCRLSSYLILTAILGCVVWIMAAAWGWSTGWLTQNYGYHDAAAAGIVHAVAGFFALGVLCNLGPRIGKYDSEGRARVFRPHNLHITMAGLMLIYTGFYGFYMACIAVTSTTFPGFYAIYATPTTLGTFALTLTFGLAGGFVGGYFGSKGDAYWTMAGGIAGGITVSPGADIYHPTVSWLFAIFGAWTAVYAGNWLERRARVDDAVGAWAIHGWCGMLGVLMLGVFVGGYPTGLDNVPTSFGGQLMGMMVIVPMSFLTGWAVSWALKKVNLLRVPPEVELEGLDYAEFQQDFYPQFEASPETVVLPTGEEVDADRVLIDAWQQTNGRGAARVPTA